MENCPNVDAPDGGSQGNNIVMSDAALWVQECSLGEVSITASTSTAEFLCRGGTITNVGTGPLTLTGSANAIISELLGVAVTGGSGPSAISVVGSQVHLTATAEVFSAPPILSGGAALSQITLLSDASGEGYTPANTGNWNGTAPTSVANALDRIAAHSGPIP